MIPLVALLLAAAGSGAAHKPSGPPDPRPAQAHFEQCLHQSDLNPAAAIADAKTWAGTGGGVLAAQCLGIAQSAAGDWKGSADSFSAAATIAGALHDDRTGNLWVSAGNAALAGGDAHRAHTALDNALATPGAPGPLRGEAFLDRARASVALGDLPAARSDLNEALRLVPGDPMTWLLSATLARRMNDLPRAAADIAEAETKAPNEPAILYESGNIAATAGNIAQARAQWTRARIADPQGDSGKAAAAELAATGGDDAPAAVPKGPDTGR